jgi:hypothetical protein
MSETRNTAWEARVHRWGLRPLWRARFGLGALQRTRAIHLRSTSDIFQAAAVLSTRHPGLSDPAADLGPRHLGTSALRPYELRVTSQNGEDGVLAEIIARIGPGDRIVAEFGAGDGSETTTGFLVDWCGWSAAYIEIDPESAERLARKHQHEPRVQTTCARITEENLEPLLRSLGVPDEPDVLSIDIDSVDFWLWKALTGIKPRIIVIEYNATVGPGRRLTTPRNHAAGWDGATDRYGASLDALIALGSTKGYGLVHTDLAGVNAFFVRDDLLDRVGIADVRRAGPNHWLGSDGPLKTDATGDQPS